MPKQKQKQRKFYVTKDGQKIVRLNPAERAKGYARDLKAGVNRRTGEVLSASQAGFRMGVLNERKLQAKIYKKYHK